MTLTVLDYLTIVFSLAGALIFLYSMFFSYKTIKLFPQGSKMVKYWYIAFILILIFFFGYIINIYVVYTGNIELQAIITAFVYIFGACFVWLIVYVSYKTYKIILE